MRLKEWSADITGGLVSVWCWFTPEHCECVTKFIALLIAIITLLFITGPKAWPQVVKCYRFWKRVLWRSNET